MCIELSYINTKHPDFTEAQIVHRALTEDRDGIKQLRKELQNKQIDEKDNRVGLYSVPNKYFLNFLFTCKHCAEGQAGWYGMLHAVKLAFDEVHIILMK